MTLRIPEAKAIEAKKLRFNFLGRKTMREIPKFPNYCITINGRIWSKPREGSSKNGKWLKLNIDSSGYLQVTLCKDGYYYPKLVHHLVLEAFIGKRPVSMECRHLDGDKKNNKISNLKWGTKRENGKDAAKHGTHKGEKSGVAKLTKQDVKSIFNMYWNKNYNKSEIAQQFNITSGHVRRIINKKTWKHIWV